MKVNNGNSSNFLRALKFEFKEFLEGKWLIPQIHLAKLYAHNLFVSQNSTIFSIHALIVDKTLLSMIVYFAIAILPHIYYCTILSNKYIMSQNHFQIADKLLSFGQHHKLCSQQRLQLWKQQNIWLHYSLLYFFFF